MTTFTIGNAAGTIKDDATVKEALRGPGHEIKFGSVTYSGRGGNLGQVYYFDSEERISLNAIGLKNLGYLVYLPLVREWAKLAHAAGKKLIVSVAGETPVEYAEMARAFIEAGADGVELNLGCPNVWKEDEQKQIPSYHPMVMAEILAAVKRALPWNSRVGAKISPVEDEGCLREGFEVLRDSGIIRFVSMVNTYPNQRRQDKNGKEVLAFQSKEGSPLIHVGGMAGSPLKPHALRVLRASHQVLPATIQKVGVGGIFTGEDLYEFLVEGADGVESGTGYYEWGARHLTAMLEQLSDIPAAAEFV